MSIRVGSSGVVRVGEAVGVTVGRGQPGVGGTPPAGYVFLRGKSADGSYTNVSGRNADATLTPLVGKT